MRKLNTMALTPEQRDYLNHDGAVDPHARVRDMDAMGIDQVLVIPTMVIMHLPFVLSAEGVDTICQAYNNFVVDWCGEEPGRLFGAALLPAQDPERTAKEIRRAYSLGHAVGLIRPIDANAHYPNDNARTMMAEGGPYDQVFKAFEETGMVLGMHTFGAPSLSASFRDRLSGVPGGVVLPGEHGFAAVLVYSRDAGLADSGAADRNAGPLSEAEDGHVRVERRVVALSFG